jgi:hypothetical protein
MRQINAGDEAVACYVTVETCQGVPDPERAVPALCDAVRMWSAQFDLPVPAVGDASHLAALKSVLSNWAELVAPKPLIVLFDEVDVLQGEALISFLRQLRDGFANRGVGKFPISIALVGMRDLKDYITASKGGTPPNPGSPFNIKSDSASIANFQKDDVIRLFAQRTNETGQIITQEALDYAYEQSQGQPWIVNSLFKRATMRVLDADSTETVTIDHIQEARKQMIEARETHLDSLGVRLRDPRIRKVIQTIMTGEFDLSITRTNPDVELAMDLGLVAWNPKTNFTIANPIYDELLTRYLDAPYHDNLPSSSMGQWENPDGTLDMDALLRAFQSFWQSNSEVWEQSAEYPEAFPHLLLMAFLQRITNGSGRIEREYAAGRGSMDLAVEYHGLWSIIEIKLLRDGKSFDHLMEEGIKQTLGYHERFAPSARASFANAKTPVKCYLIIFDRRKKKPSWGERLKWLIKDEVTVVGC